MSINIFGKRNEKKVYTEKQAQNIKRNSFNNGVMISFITIAGVQLVTGGVKLAAKGLKHVHDKKKEMREEEFEADDFAEDPDVDDAYAESEKADSDFNNSNDENPQNDPVWDRVDEFVKTHKTATVSEEEPSEPVVTEKKAEDVEHVAVVVQKVQVPKVDDRSITPEEIKEFAGIDLEAVKALAEYIDKMPKELRKEVSDTIKDGKFPKVEGVDPDAVKRLGNFMMEAGIKEEPIPEPSEDKSEDEKSEDEPSDTSEEKEERTA